MLTEFASVEAHEEYCAELESRGYQSNGFQPSLTLCPRCGKGMFIQTLHTYYVTGAKETKWCVKNTYMCPECKAMFKESPDAQ